MRSSQASSRGKARRDGTQQLTRSRVPERRLAATPPAPIRAAARTSNTANTTAAQRSAATQQLRGTFADNARDRKLADELIVERRAEALAEDHAADAPSTAPWALRTSHARRAPPDPRRCSSEKSGPG
ncbi:MAG: hypothetical protein ACLP4R_06520 [Solirubrobacteraceae bacterium]